MVLAWLVGCGRPPPPAAVRRLDPPPPPSQPAVVLGNGWRVLGGVLPDTLTAGARTEAKVWLEVGTPGPLVAELQVWDPGAAGPAAAASYTVAGDAPPGAVVEATLPLALPTDLSPGPHPVYVGFPGVEVDRFRGDHVALGVAFAGGGAPPGPPLRARPTDGGITLAVGGDVNLGRRTGLLLTREGPAAPLGSVRALAEADLALANLECTLGDRGAPVEKGEAAEFYFRGRPEAVEVLRAAGIDGVGTANNHGGDYGPDGVLETLRWLRAGGVGAAGSGADRATACAPTFRTAGATTLALFALDSTQESFAAGPDRPGTCFVRVDRPDEVAAWLAPAIARARKAAHVVVVGIHWGPNNAGRPTAERSRLGHILVDTGADAVVGSSAHRTQGIEVYRGRPILYDTGNLLFDAADPGEHERGAVFTLSLDAAGVHRVAATPLHLAIGRTEVAVGNEAAATLLRLRDLSAELGTAVSLEGGLAVVELPPPPPRPPPTEPPPTDEPGGPVPPATTPPPGCVVDEVPADAALPPRRVGPLELVGARLGPPRMVGRDHAVVDTWWRVREPAPADLLVGPVLVRRADPTDRRWDSAHQPCDGGWPADRLVPGQILHDHALVRPPGRAAPGAYDLEAGLDLPDRRLGGVPDLGVLEFELPPDR